MYPYCFANFFAKLYHGNVVPMHIQLCRIPLCLCAYWSVCLLSVCVSHNFNYGITEVRVARLDRYNMCFQDHLIQHTLTSSTLKKLQVFVFGKKKICSHFTPIEFSFHREKSLAKGLYRRLIRLESKYVSFHILIEMEKHISYQLFRCTFSTSFFCIANMKQKSVQRKMHTTYCSTFKRLQLPLELTYQDEIRYEGGLWHLIYSQIL